MTSEGKERKQKRKHNPVHQIFCSLQLGLVMKHGENWTKVSYLFRLSCAWVACVTPIVPTFACSVSYVWIWTGDEQQQQLQVSRKSTWETGVCIWLIRLQRSASALLVLSAPPACQRLEWVKRNQTSARPAKFAIWAVEGLSHKMMALGTSFMVLHNLLMAGKSRTDTNNRERKRTCVSPWGNATHAWNLHAPPCESASFRLCHGCPSMKDSKQGEELSDCRETERFSKINFFNFGQDLFTSLTRTHEGYDFLSLLSLISQKKCESRNETVTLSPWGRTYSASGHLSQSFVAGIADLALNSGRQQSESHNSWKWITVFKKSRLVTKSGKDELGESSNPADLGFGRKATDLEQPPGNGCQTSPLDLPANSGCTKGGCHCIGWACLFGPKFRFTPPVALCGPEVWIFHCQLGLLKNQNRRTQTLASLLEHSGGSNTHQGIKYRLGWGGVNLWGPLWQERAMDWSQFCLPKESQAPNSCLR